MISTLVHCRYNVSLFCILQKRLIQSQNLKKGKLSKPFFLLQKLLILGFFKISTRCSPFMSNASVDISWQMLAIAVFLILQTTTTRAQGPLQAVLETVNNAILFDEAPFSEIISDSSTSCSRQCIRDKRCKSANFVKSDGKCSLMDKTRRTHPLLFLQQVDTVHLQKVLEIISKTKIIYSSAV